MIKYKKNEKLDIKVSLTIDQKYIKAITRLLKDVTKALQNYTVALKKLGKEE